MRLFAGALFLGLAGGELFLIDCLFLDQTFCGACFHGGFCLLEFGNAVLATLDFVGDGEAVLERGAVGSFGFLEKLGDLLFGELHLFGGVAVTHGAVFAGVGEDFGAVDGDGDVADLQHAGVGGEFEDLMKGVGEEVFVFAAELADRVVVGVGVAGEEAHGDVFVGERLDAATGEGACRVTVNQQTEHHGGWVLGAAGAALGGVRSAQVQRFDRIHDEMDHVAGRDSVAQVGRQEHRHVVVNVDEAGRDSFHTPPPADLFRESEV